MKQTHRRTTTQKRDLKKAALPLHENQTHAQIRPRKFAAHLQDTLLRENTSGGLRLDVKRILKDLNCEKFLFTVVKRNLLTLKMDKQIKK